MTVPPPLRAKPMEAPRGRHEKEKNLKDMNGKNKNKKENMKKRKKKRKIDHVIKVQHQHMYP